MRKLLSVACLVGGLAATACAPTAGVVPALQSNTAGTSNLSDPRRLADADFDTHIAEMRRRFPSRALGTPAQRVAVARELYEYHLSRRRDLGLPEPDEASRANLISLLANEPVEAVAVLAPLERDAQERAAARERIARDRILLEEVTRLDGRPISSADVSRVAANLVNATQPGLPRDQYRTALAAAEAEVRSALEERRQSLAFASARRREADLTRLALTGLGDMPREIALAAAENLSDARSPFDTRPNWRPDPAALRQEEVRLRNAIASRMEAERRQADQNARASANAAASRQQADLQRAIEMARADAERERRERQSQRLMEIGFGMMAGANRPPPPSNDGTRTYNINGRMFTCTTSGTFTNCF